MGRFQSAAAAAAAAVVVASLLLSLACDAAVLGDPSSSPSTVKLKQQQPAAHVRELYDACEDDVEISQDETPPEPEPAPRFSVMITNSSTRGRKMYNVSVSCAGFDDASINVLPSYFRRISQSECLLNDGGDLLPFDPVVFEYVSRSQYPFKVTSASC